MLTLNWLANLLLKPALLLALGWLLFRQESNRSASHQHQLLSCLLLCLPLPALAGLSLTGLNLYLPGLMEPHWLLQPWQQWLAQPWTQALLAIYLFGLLFCLFYTLLGLLLLRGLEHHSRPDARLQSRLDRLCQLTGQPPLPVGISAGICQPQVWGWRRPVILLPESAQHAQQAQLDLILLHELGHVARRDWLIGQAVGLVCALLWWLWPAWWLARRQRDLAERATDDWVLAVQNRPADYAELLLASARSLRHDLPSQALNGSPLFARIQWLLDTGLDREQRQPGNWLTGLLLLGLLIATLGALQLQPQPRQPHASLVQWTLMPMEYDAAASDAPLAPSPSAALTEPPRLRLPVGRATWQEELRVTATPISPTQVPDPAAPEIAIGRPDALAMLPLQLVTPDYPERAKRRHIQGLVRLGFAIDPDGYPRDIQVLQSPSPLLSRAAVKALQASRYAAPRLNGQAVRLTQLTEDYRFTLHPPDS